MKVEIKVGLFVLAAIVLLMFGAAFVGNISIGNSGYSFSVQYGFSGDLRIRGKLKMGGGEVVGYITKISYDKTTNLTNITVRVDENVKIYRNASFVITSANMMGERFINVSGGSESAGFVTDGLVIRGEESVGMDGAMSKATETMEELKKILSTLNSTIGEKEVKKSIQKGINSMSQTVQDTQPKVLGILDNVAELTKVMAQTSRSLHELSNSMVKVAGEKNQESITRTLQNIEGITTKLNATMTHMETLATKIDNAEGPIGVMLSDKKMGEDLKALMKDLRANPSILLWGPKK